MKGAIRLTGSAVAWSAAAFAVSAPVAVHATPWQASDDDSLMLDLRSGQYKLGESMRGYQTPEGVCVDLADLIQALDLPVRLDRKSRRATGWIFAESERFILDRDSSTVQNMKRRGADRRKCHPRHTGRLVRDTRALSSWFGVTFQPNLGSLSVVLETDRKLPFLQAIERRSRAARLSTPRSGTFDLASLPKADTPYRDWRTPAVDVTLRSLFTEHRGQSRTELRYEALASGEVLGASFSARLVSDQSVTPESLRLRLFRNDPDGGMLGRSRRRRSLPAMSRPMPGPDRPGGGRRGLFVSNRPIDRPARFSTTTIRGTLPAGWDAELYRNGQLRAFMADRGDGRYEFPDVELLFGANEFEVVLYGPQGQIRRDKTNIRSARRICRKGRPGTGRESSSRIVT